MSKHNLSAGHLLTAATLVGVTLPLFAFAGTIGGLIDAFTALFTTLIPIMISLAVLVFFWGLVKFINHADDEKAVDEGKSLMVYGMIAIFIMVALWAIIGWLQSEFGLNSTGSLGTLQSIPNSIP